jgi:hypothetical protein
VTAGIAGGADTGRPGPLQRKLPVEQLRMLRGFVEIGSGLRRLASRFRRAAGPVKALGENLGRAAAARIAQEHRRRVRRAAELLQRGRAGKPGEAGIFVALARRAVDDLRAGGESVPRLARDLVRPSASSGRSPRRVR